MFLYLILATGCTEQEIAKNYGGETTCNLPKGQKLIIVTWKDDDLWYLTRPMKADDSAEIYVLQEESSYGIWNGKVNIIENK
jgi:hypothetical protein